jgi:hypothetical protein
MSRYYLYPSGVYIGFYLGSYIGFWLLGTVWLLAFTIYALFKDLISDSTRCSSPRLSASIVCQLDVRSFRIMELLLIHPTVRNCDHEAR